MVFSKLRGKPDASIPFPFRYGLDTQAIDVARYGSLLEGDMGCAGLLVEVLIRNQGTFAQAKEYIVKAASFNKIFCGNICFAGSNPSNI